MEGIRYLVTFSDGGVGMRTRNEPLVVGDELVDCGERYLRRQGRATEHAGRVRPCLGRSGALTGLVPGRDRPWCPGASGRQGQASGGAGDGRGRAARPPPPQQKTLGLSDIYEQFSRPARASGAFSVWCVSPGKQLDCARPTEASWQASRRCELFARARPEGILRAEGASGGVASMTATISVGARLGAPRVVSGPASPSREDASIGQVAIPLGRYSAMRTDQGIDRGRTKEPT